MNLRHLALAATLALATLLSGTASAAIPCGPNPLLPTPPDQVMPLIYRELPIPIADLLRGSQPVDRAATPEVGTPAATPAANDGSGAVTAAQNLFRCVGYGDSVAFLYGTTPQFRALRVSIGDPVDGTEYISVGDGLYVVEIGDAESLPDGRSAVDFAAIVDGDNYIAGELIFAEDDGFSYLDDSFLTTETELNGETTEVVINEVFTREVKIYDVTEGDRIVWRNEAESAAIISVTTADGEEIFSGHVLGDGMVGGENKNVLPIVNLEPGEYTVHIAFEGSGVASTATIVVAP